MKSKYGGLWYSHDFPRINKEKCKVTESIWGHLLDNLKTNSNIASNAELVSADDDLWVMYSVH